MLPISTQEHEHKNITTRILTAEHINTQTLTQEH